MLHLLDTPHWQAADQRRELPDVLPGWTVAFLALQGDWVGRDRLCAMLWPDSSASAAQHNLRVNLHRVRALLADWGIGEALHTDRQRVRLSVPTDVGQLRQALCAPAQHALVDGHRKPLLSGMGFSGFPALQDWAAAERAAWQGRWRAAVLSRLHAGVLAASEAADWCHALLQADPLDEEAMLAQLRGLRELGREGEARRLYRQFAERLRHEVGVDPPAPLQALAASLSPPLAGPRGLAARDGFVGRARELDQVQAMLGAGRIVTIIGAGGVGKSRLARECAQRSGAHWRHDAAWVALADLDQAAGLLPRLAQQLGLTLAQQDDARPQLSAALATREGLIVLDNAEHLDDLPALLADLRQAAPASAWLVTSRVPLNLAMERTYMLDGLDRPEPDEAPGDLDEARAFDAMRLFESRALVADPHFDLDRHWAACLDLVRATGGWPLAIELAAAAVAHHEPAAVLADLRQSIDTLAAGQAPRQARHDSMRESLSLSWRLLGPDERAALAQLSVFRGGFTRAAALAVTGGGGVSLARLLERSLVQVQGPGRFDLHPLVAQFAAERLADDLAQQRAAAQRHCDHYIDRLQHCAAAPANAVASLLQALECDLENTRKAWASLVQRRDSARIAASAAAWSTFGTAKGRARELRQLVTEAMPASAGHAPARSALLQASAILHYRCAELDAAQALAREAWHAATAVGDMAGQRTMLNTQALVLKDLGRYPEAQHCAQMALQQARAAGDELELANCANTCAILAKMQGDQAGAAALYAEAIAVHRRHANHRSLAVCLNNLGNVHRALGDAAAAQRSFEECLRVAEGHGISSTRAFAMVNLALVHQQAGRLALARSFAQRARDDPAAENAVLLAAEAVAALVAIEERAFDRAAQALQALATRARATGLHAALLEAVNCHAKLLAAQGQRDAALARWAYLIAHPQQPAMARDDARLALRRLGPDADEIARAESAARAFELDVLIDEVLAQAQA